MKAGGCSFQDDSGLPSALVLPEFGERPRLLNYTEKAEREGGDDNINLVVGWECVCLSIPEYVYHKLLCFNKARRNTVKRILLLGQYQS